MSSHHSLISPPGDPRHFVCSKAKDCACSIQSIFGTLPGLILFPSSVRRGTISEPNHNISFCRRVTRRGLTDSALAWGLLTRG